MLINHLPTLKLINKELQEKYAGKPVYIILSGSHLYGFPSADSDFDYRGVFLAKTNKYIGINDFPKQYRNEKNDLDIVLDEAKFACGKLLQSNYNFLEHLYGEPLESTAEHLELRRIIGDGGISRTGLYKSYKGVATSNYDDYILKGRNTSSKKYLYVLRGLISGAYALNTGKIEPDITKLSHNYPEVDELVRLKKDGGEWTSVGRVEKYDKLVDELFKELRDANTTSNLPDEQDMDVKPKVDEWLKKYRLRYLDGYQS